MTHISKALLEPYNVTDKIKKRIQKVTGYERRLILSKHIVFFLILVTTLLTGCQRGPSTSMKGTYVSVGSTGNAKLEVTSDKMTLSSGPITIAVTYRIVKVNGSNVTVEVSAPDMPKGQFDVSVGNDSLDIKNSMAFYGHWVRK